MTKVAFHADLFCLNSLVMAHSKRTSNFREGDGSDFTSCIHISAATWAEIHLLRSHTYITTAQGPMCSSLKSVFVIVFYTNIFIHYIKAEKGIFGIEMQLLTF